MRTQSICLIIMALAGALIAGDPDSGKKFTEEYDYLTNITTGEHYLPGDTISLEKNISTIISIKYLKDGEWHISDCLNSCAWYFTNEDNSNWRSREDYIRIEGNEGFTLIKEFEGVYKLYRAGGLYNTAVAYIKVFQPDTTDPSKNVGIFKEGGNSETPLDTLILNTNDRVWLSFKRLTANGWKNAEATWYINYCGKNEGVGIVLGPVSCNHAGTGTITATSIDNPEVTVTITVIFEEPVSAVQPPHVLKSKQSMTMGCQTFDLNGRRISNKEISGKGVYLSIGPNGTHKRLRNH